MFFMYIFKIEIYYMLKSCKLYSFFYKNSLLNYIKKKDLNIRYNLLTLFFIINI